MNRDQALSKIKKCVALAKSNNPHEAEAAMRQAQKLMTEHNLTETDVSLADVMESAAPAQLNAFTPWEATLAHIISGAFGCEHFSKTDRHLTRSLDLVRKREYIFVGVGAAPQVASYAYEVLSRQCARDRLAHIRKQPKNCKPITKTARGDEFALGWVYGVRGRVESFAGTERDKLLIEQYMTSRHPDMTSATIKDRAKGRNVSHNDVHEGLLAGRQAQINHGVSAPGQQRLLK
jgi:hypothetical protein